MKRIKITRHETVTPSGPLNCGTIEVSFPDGRESVFFQWDDDKSRRLRPEAMDSAQAIEAARALARIEQAKLDKGPA